ncbi:hypothetical protein F4808DRAFT_475800 [Astrocystis sublimbata]|nr:hypothetical protein F4808DRAFT_475800 [Astrocystis sublimbata]
MASSEWHQYKALIIQLYILDHRPLQDVISYMSENHNFTKKKSQYEYQLKKWGIKKNLKREEWEHLRNQIQKRAGKQTEVTMCNVPLSLSRVRRNTQRYNRIPTVEDFGKSVPSPRPIEQMVVRTRTPPPMEVVAWPSLPWFSFKNRIFPILKNPSRLMSDFLAAFGSDDIFLQYDGKSAFTSLFRVSRSPPELRTVALELTKRIPKDDIDREQREEALQPKQFTLSMATEMLRLVFYNLSNNHIPDYHNKEDLQPRSAMIAAASTCDIELAQILLREEADLDDKVTGCPSFLDYAAHVNGDNVKSDRSVEFAKLLLEHRAQTDQPMTCPVCRHIELILPVAIAIECRNDSMAEFLIEMFMSIPNYETSDAPGHGCDRPHQLLGLHVRGGHSTPLNAVLVLGKRKLIDKLLRMLLSNTNQASMQVIKNALLAGCLVGDTDTVFTILKRHPTLQNEESWKGPIKPLTATAWNEDTTIAKLLIASGACIGPKLCDGSTHVSSPTPLHAAASHNNASLVGLLMDLGVNCNVVMKPRSKTRRKCTPNWILLQSDCPTPLQCALASGSIATIKLLLKQSKPIGAELVPAVYLGDHSIFHELVSKGANILSVDRYGWSVLDAIANTKRNCTFPIIPLYFESGGVYRSQALVWAIDDGIKSNDHSMARFVVSKRPLGDIDKNEIRSFILCIHHRIFDLISLFLRKPFLPGPTRLATDTHRLLDGNPYYISDYDHRGTPLGMAILIATHDLKVKPVVKDMIRLGYEIHEQDVRLWFAAVPNHVHGAIWSTYSSEPMSQPCLQAFLLHSIASGNEEKVLKYVMGVETLDFVLSYSGYCPCGCCDTPLMVATCHGNVKLVWLLLENGADVNFESYYGSGPQTALQLAAMEGNLELVKLFLERRADVDLIGSEGANALQYSSIQGHLSVAQLLLSRGAEINALPAKQDGRTALEGAAEHGRLDTVCFLMEMGAGLRGQMRIYYLRAIGLARYNGHTDIADRLVEMGGPWNERDHALYARLGTFDPDNQDWKHFQYVEEEDDWHIRKLKVKRDGTWGSVGSSDSQYATTETETESEISDSDDDSELDDPDTGLEQESDMEDVTEVPGGSYYNTDGMIQPWLEGLPSRIIANAFTDQHILGYDLDSFQIPTRNRVMELGEPAEDDLVSIHGSHYNSSGNADEYDMLGCFSDVFGPIE